MLSKLGAKLLSWFSFHKITPTEYKEKLKSSSKATRKIFDEPFNELASYESVHGAFFDTKTTISIPVIGINMSLMAYIVEGDKTNEFLINDKFMVRGSAKNNGQYTIDSSIYDGTNTIILVRETISRGITDGVIYVSGPLSNPEN